MSLGFTIPKADASAYLLVKIGATRLAAGLAGPYPQI